MEVVDHGIYHHAVIALLHGKFTLVFHGTCVDVASVLHLYCQAIAQITNHRLCKHKNAVLYVVNKCFNKENYDSSLMINSTSNKRERLRTLKYNKFVLQNYQKICDGIY